jgi:hypothetical protein
MDYENWDGAFSWFTIYDSSAVCLAALGISLIAQALLAAEISPGRMDKEAAPLKELISSVFHSRQAKAWTPDSIGD